LQSRLNILAKVEYQNRLFTRLDPLRLGSASCLSWRSTISSEQGRDAPAELIH
jgi:hypothetical protein